MGKPAARIGDSTIHGGVIMAGAPTVLIGGMPAARMNDLHVCPMLNPGVPPPPHVGQQILLGSPTVLICGQMAARLGDSVMCSGPPDSIAMGCPTVMIGESASGGGGAAGPAGAATSAALAGGGTEPEMESGHFLDLNFVDKAGKPIKNVKYTLKDPAGGTSEGTLQGNLKKTGIEQGNYDLALLAVTSAKWSKRGAEAGEKVKLQVETSGIDSGTPAKLEIYVRDGNSSDRLLNTMESSVNNDKVEAEWEFRVDEEFSKSQDATEKAGGYSVPQFYFLVKAGQVSGRSGLLRLHDQVEINLKDEDGKPLAGKKYRAVLSSGEIKEGKLDSKGHAKIEKIPPGKVVVSYDVRG
jgi:uncharacterized Zn-binding protein involved in type VI secretion